VIIPPWICMTGKFPFQFQPVFAIAGSLLLRVVEWMIVLKTKSESLRNGTELQESSIFRSQQMNVVTVPIKLRAVGLGLISGYDDVHGKQDHSFWVSTGGVEKAVQWVQTWLCAVMLLMFASVIAAVIIAATRRDQDTIEACVFGIILAVVQIWILWEPCFFVMQGQRLQISLRHTEVIMLLGVGLAFILISAQAPMSIISL
jgi:hypothetical protein